MQISVEQVWAWLSEVPDPEIPVVSIVELGIIRDVAWADETLTITVTPTYSGCPATEVIAESIREALAAQGIENLRLKTQLSPAWTTDWMQASAKEKLRGYGIAPPAEQVIDSSRIMRRTATPALRIACPLCGSTHTEQISASGSTPCKALHRCRACLEPFDYFKCH